MALRDYKYPEVRVRNGSKFQQIPNYVIAAEELKNGMFVRYGEDGIFYKVTDHTDRPTHLVQRSGIVRVTIDEIANLTGIVQAGEPVFAYTGEGTATIPFASDVSKGDSLTVVDGYAVVYDESSGLSGDLRYIVGQAVEDVEIPEGATIAWGEALLTLPAELE